MPVEINGTTYDANHVECPSCSETVDAQVVLVKRECPGCGIDYSAFFDEEPDPTDVEIQRNFDGSVEVEA